MREVDKLTTQRYAVPSLLLMENAAVAAVRAIAATVNGELKGKNVLVLCGPGNNGGDGAALARHLCLRGASVDVVLIGKRAATKGDAAANFNAIYQLAEEGQALRETATPDINTWPLFSNCEGSLRWLECAGVEEWEQYAYNELPSSAIDIVVDALFGTGLSRPLNAFPAEVVRYLQRARDFRDHIKSQVPLFVALDLPSGLNADAAVPDGVAVKADLTVTFTAPKPANVLLPAAEYSGKLVVANIGTPLKLLDDAPSQLFVTEREDARTWLVRTRYRQDSHKRTHGHALVAAGSRRFTGAASLCAQAAMRSGAGLVTVATPASAQLVIEIQTGPEVMTVGLEETWEGAFTLEAAEHLHKLAEKAHVIALGSGVTSNEDSTRQFVRQMVTERTLPMVIDADGLNALAPWPDDIKGTAELPLILTPHQGEFLRLLGTDDAGVLADRVTAVRDFATQHGVILVLKGARTLTGGPDGRVFINPTGNPGLGTAGAGDTLTGIITGFNAQAAASAGDVYDPLVTTVAAVYIAGLAGDLAAQQRGMRALMASDVTEYLGPAINTLDPEGERP